MTAPDSPDLTDRARTLAATARAIGAGVDTAASELLRLGGDVAYAGTRREVARFGAQVAAEREMLSRLLDELIGIAASADQLDAEVDAEFDAGQLDAEHDGPARAGGALSGGALEGARGVAGEALIVLGEVRRVVSEVGARARECEWLGDLATDRVRDFAEFELLHSQASRHLERHDLEAADAVMIRLVALERVLLAPEPAEMLDELKYRLLVARG